MQTFANPAERRTGPSGEPALGERVEGNEGDPGTGAGGVYC